MTGGFDSGRFGDTPAADKGGRVTGAQTAGKASASPDPGRFGGSVTAERGGRVAGPSTTGSISRQSTASVGRQSSVNGQYNNGGINAGQVAQAAAGSVMAEKGSRVTSTPMAEKGSRVVGNGLAAGISPPSVSARMAETKSMAELNRPSSPNYGNGLAVAARQAEVKSLNSLHDYDREVVGVRAAGKGWTQVERRDGTVETRTGARASRNNNPGNIEYGSYAKKKGSIGTDGRFAVFSSPAQGLKAMEDLVFGEAYANRTIQQAIDKYAPPHENNSKAYASTIAKAAGVPVGAVVGSLSPEQRTSLIGAMTRVEGNHPYSTKTVEAGTPRGVPRSGSPVVAEATSGLPAASRTPASERFATNYLGQTSVPTPTARPGVPTPTSRPNQASTRSTVDKVVAGAIDLGVGMIPGVGPAAAIYSAAAPMLGLPTVGDLALNMRDRNGFDLKTALRSRDGDTGGSREERLSGAQPMEAEEAVAETAPASAPVAASTFAEKYLAFSDPTPRPTPSQKWGGSGVNSVPYTG